MKPEMRWTRIVSMLALMASSIGCSAGSDSTLDSAGVHEVVVSESTLKSMQETAVRLDAMVSALDDSEQAHALNEPLQSVWSEARQAGYRTVWIEALPTQADGKLRVSDASLRDVQQQLEIFEPVLEVIERPSSAIPVSVQRAYERLQASALAGNALEATESELPSAEKALREKRCCRIMSSFGNYYCNTYNKATKVGAALACAHEMGIHLGVSWSVVGGSCSNDSKCP